MRGHCRNLFTCDGRVYITITDNGPGISPKLLSAILLFCKSIVESLSGVGYTTG
jgi:signal transduction histidine kinase